MAVAFFGEGATSRGDVHEAMNFAGVHKLPVIFVCENNRYAYSTPLEKQMAIEDVADRAAAYGFKGHKGYQAAAHIDALKAHGPSPIHRLSWATVKAVL